MDTKKSQSFADLLAACKQDSVDPEFVESRWPLESIAADESEWEVCEYFFTDMENGVVKLCRLKKLAEDGEIRVCGVRRAMTYVASHLDLQLNHELVVPLVALHPDVYPCLPIFAYGCINDVDNRVRQLCLYDASSYSRGFYPRFGWLVLRKRRQV